MENKYYMCLENDYEIEITAIEREMAIKLLKRGDITFEFRNYVIVLSRVIMLKEVSNV